MKNMDQYAGIQKWKSGNVTHPVRVIAETHEGYLLESHDFWNILGFGQGAELIEADIPPYTPEAARELEKQLKSRFDAIYKLSIHVITHPSRAGHHVLVHMMLRRPDGKLNMRCYFTWEHTIVRALAPDNVITFNDITTMLDEVFVDEFVWDADEYMGKHKRLPVTVFARGAAMGIVKVHTDEPKHPQHVFRGTPKRLVDLVIQAKAHLQVRP